MIKSLLSKRVDKVLEYEDIYNNKKKEIQVCDNPIMLLKRRKEEEAKRKKDKWKEVFTDANIYEVAKEIKNKISKI